MEHNILVTTDLSRGSKAGLSFAFQRIFSQSNSEKLSFDDRKPLLVFAK